MEMHNHPRTGGFVIFMIGAVISAWFYQSTIERAATHDDEIMTIPFGFAALVAISCLGLTLMFFGTEVQAYSRGLRDRKKNPKDFLIFGLFFLPGIIAFYLLYQQLTQLGYHYR